MIHNLKILCDDKILDVKSVEIKTREDLFNTISLLAIWGSIRGSHLFGLHRCQLCKTGKKISKDKTCEGEEDCIKNGFSEPNSIYSALRVIKNELSKRS